VCGEAGVTRVPQLFSLLLLLGLCQVLACASTLEMAREVQQESLATERDGLVRYRHVVCFSETRHEVTGQVQACLNPFRVFRVAIGEPHDQV
jgi:hypothetical protein